jgi:hypothetical protein
MSELKAFNMPRYAGQFTQHEVYFKSEADKVIAEKDAEIARLKAIRKVHVKAIESMGAGLQQDEEEIRHQKYKRCLAMAYVEWLKQMILCNYPDSILYRRASRRERKWKKIAEKFKPNKEAK